MVTLPGLTILAPFSGDTGYFGRRERKFMVNSRVCDLDAMLSRLRAAGVEALGEEEEEGQGASRSSKTRRATRGQLWEPRL